MAEIYGKGNGVIRSFQEFFSKSTAGGIVLIAMTAIAMLWANSPFHEAYHSFLDTRIFFGLGGYDLFDRPLHEAINDGLMAVFFFSVGLEIKRELVTGELSSPRQAMLPMIAALGGVLFPMLIFALMNSGSPVYMKGLAVPMATDIAFSLGVLALLGERVPIQIKVFLAALAIADDLMAVIVIALFYTDAINTAALMWGGFFVLLMLIFNRVKINRVFPYLASGICLWFCFLKSGIHPTISGVMAAFAIPASPLISKESFLAVMERLWTGWKKNNNSGNMLMNEEQVALTHTIEKGFEKVQPLLNRIEHGLQPYVSFLIMPVFALANAGIAFDRFDAGVMFNTLTLGIALGLVIGKSVGVSLFVWLSVRLKIAALPEGVSFSKIASVAFLCGIGFTMSLFIASLAFPPGSDEEIYSKTGIMAGSLVSGITGYLIMRKRS